MGERALAPKSSRPTPTSSAMRRELGAALRAGAWASPPGAPTTTARSRRQGHAAAEVDGARARGHRARLRGPLGRACCRPSATSTWRARARPLRRRDRRAALHGARRQAPHQSISLMQRFGDSEQWRRVSRASSRPTPRASRSRAGRAARHRRAARPRGDLPPLHGLPQLQGRLAAAARGARRRAARPEVKARLLAETSDPVAGDGSSVPPLADQLLANLDFVSLSLFGSATKPELRAAPRGSLFGEAMRRGVKPARGRSTTRCSRTTARRCSTSRSTTTRRATLDEVGQMLRTRWR
jgi:hypothetical protein